MSRIVRCLSEFVQSRVTSKWRRRWLAAGLAVLAVRIRKAMGASTGEILRLLLWQFTRPVLWANLIAWPAGYYAMSQ